MGFLDHSTNNIIIDAVLTDYGRRLLAENQGGFRIAFFSLGDDEVDYTTIRKFGRTVGKEKIAKNTPIFEAQTGASQALKHRLITLPDPLINQMPSMTFATVGEGIGATEGATNAVTITTDAQTSITFTQSISAGTIPTGLVDQTYTILLNDRFLGLPSGQKISTQPNSRIAAFSQTKTGTAGSGGSTITLDISRNTLSPTVWSQFGDYGTSGQRITSVVSVIGDQSGLRKDIKVTIVRS